MRLFWLLLIALGCVLASSRGDAAAYDFVVVASSAGPFQSLPPMAPSLDANGAVAFVGSGSAGSGQIFVGSQLGCSLDDYVQVSGLPGQPSLSQVNGVGRMLPNQVAFGARSSNTDGVYRGSGGSLALVYAGPGDEIDEPAVNSAGTLALIDGDEIQTATDQIVSTLFSLGDDLPDGNHIDLILRPAPDIDDAGQVAFFASYRDLTAMTCDDKVLLSQDAGSPAVLADGGVVGTDCPFFTLDVTTPFALSASGQVAFLGSVEDASQGLIDAVFVDEIAVWNDQLPGFGDSPIPDAVALNGAGLAAFQLDVAGRHSINLALGDDPLQDKVLASGDALCGSTVSDVSFHRFGLNDAGQLALLVRLMDGRSLVVRADPSQGLGGQCETACGPTTWPVPEPEGPLSEVAAVLALVRIRRRVR